MAAITVSELVKEVGIAKKELGAKFSQEHLLSVSSFLDWRQAAPYLELSKNEISDIELEGKTEQEKRRKTLEMWSGKHGFKATYRKLVDALLASSKADDAEKVCRLLVKGEQSDSSSTSTSATPLQSSSEESEESPMTLAATQDSDLPGATLSVRIGKRNRVQTMPRRQAPKKKRKLLHEIQKLDLVFGKLARQTHRKLKNTVDLDEFKYHLNHLPVSMKQRHIKFFSGNLTAINRSKDVAKIFRILGRYWDFLNYSLLQHIIDEFGDKQLKRDMLKYSKQIKLFCQQTTVRQYNWIRDLPPYHSKLIVTMPNEWMDCTLDYLDWFVRGVSCQAPFEKFAVSILKKRGGSLVLSLGLHCSFPVSELVLLCQSMATRHFLRTHGVLKIQFKNVCVYESSKDGQKASAQAQLEHCIEMSSHQPEGLTQLENQPPKMESKPEKPPATAQMDQQEAAKGVLEQAEQQALEQKVQTMAEQLRTLQVENKDLLAALDQRDAQLHYESKEKEYLEQRVKQLQQKSEGQEKGHSQQQVEEQKVQMTAEQLRTLQVENKDLLAALDQRDAQLHYESKERENFEERVKQLQQRIEGQEKEAVKEKEHSQQQVEELEQQLQKVMKEKEQFQQKIEELEEQLQQPLKERKHSHPELEELKQQLEDEQTQKPHPPIPNSPATGSEVPASPIPAPQQQATVAIAAVGTSHTRDEVDSSSLGKSELQVGSSDAQKPHPTVPDSPTNTASAPTFPPQESDREPLAQKPRPTIPDSPSNTASAPTSPPQERDRKPLDPSHETDTAKCKNMISQLQLNLRTLATRTLTVMEQVDVSEFRSTITSLPASLHNERHTLINSHTPEVAHASSLNELFKYVELYYWDYLNYGVLEKIVEMYGDEKTRQMMKQYAADIAVFSKQTRLDVFMEAHEVRQDIPPDFVSLKVTLNWNVREKTLYDVERLKRVIAAYESGFPEYALMFYGICMGSVIITFLVPKFFQVPPMLSHSHIEPDDYDQGGFGSGKLVPIAIMAY